MVMNLAVQEYFNKVPEASRLRLMELRDIILEALPETEEVMNYGVPAYTLVPGGKRDQQVMIGGFKHHIGLYPHPSVIEAFKHRLAAYKLTPGTIQFPLTEPLPGKLITEMLHYRRKMLRS